MRLQDVADRIDTAISRAKRLPDTSAKADILYQLETARSDLTRFSEAITATLDNMGRSLDKR